MRYLTNYIVVERVRIHSGIPGLDEMLSGGFVKGTVILVAGESGTCKTILGCQFILGGLEKGENCLYVSLEERAEDIIDNMSAFHWDFPTFIQQKNCKFVNIEPGDIGELTTRIFSEIKALNATRVVLDSISVAGMAWKERPEEMFKLRIKIFDMLKLLKNSGVTTLLVSEIPSSLEGSRFGFEEFLADCIIYMYNIKQQEIRFRGMEVFKMRGSPHSNRTVPFALNDSGILVYPKQTIFR